LSHRSVHVCNDAPTAPRQRFVQVATPTESGLRVLLPNLRHYIFEPAPALSLDRVQCGRNVRCAARPHELLQVLSTHPKPFETFCRTALRLTVRVPEIRQDVLRDLVTLADQALDRGDCVAHVRGALIHALAHPGIALVPPPQRVDRQRPAVGRRSACEVLREPVTQRTSQSIQIRRRSSEVVRRQTCTAPRTSLRLVVHHLGFRTAALAARVLCLQRIREGCRCHLLDSLSTDCADRPLRLRAHQQISRAEEVIHDGVRNRQGHSITSSSSAPNRERSTVLPFNAIPRRIVPSHRNPTFFRNSPSGRAGVLALTFCSWKSCTAFFTTARTTGTRTAGSLLSQKITFRLPMYRGMMLVRYTSPVSSTSTNQESRLRVR